MILASQTDIGIKRTVNQDSHITKKYSKKTTLCVVCDGMGGAKGGEEASKIASKAFVEYMDTFLELYVGNKKDKVTAKEEVNLRALPNTDSEILGKLYRGEYLTRTATSTHGWSRLIYNGQVVYCVTSFVTNEVVGE